MPTCAPILDGSSGWKGGLTKRKSICSARRSSPPRHDDAWHNLGIVFKRQRKPARAISAFKRALRIEPRRPESLIALGDLLLADQQAEAAIRSYRLAVSACSGRTPARAKLAQCLADRDRLDEAEQIFRDALAIDDRDTEAWLGLGYLSEDRGDKALAEECYRRAIAVTPGQGFAIGRLLALVGGSADPELVRLATWALAAASVPDEARALVGYGLGKVREATGDFRGAFDAYATANAARRRESGPLDRTALTARVDRMIRESGEDCFWPGSTGSDSTLPVFVVGMPRSGTTLVEQILASHPLVHGAGELAALTEVSKRCQESPDLAQLADPARDYLQALAEGAPPGCSRIVDKAPLNFFFLGVVARLFPKARIIHCTRDPRDVCFSIFAENFAPLQTYATDLSDLAFYWKEHRRLMDSWSKTLQLSIMEVRYETTIAELEETARRLCAFVRIPWDDRCLAFHENTRVVRTPSRWQVRQPLYGTSVGRWKRFADFLGPLLNNLPPPEGRFADRR